eukprot:364111-Chlamydomonas_euryale.AAC.23
MSACLDLENGHTSRPQVIISYNVYDPARWSAWRRSELLGLENGKQAGLKSDYPIFCLHVRRKAAAAGAAAIPRLEMFRLCRIGAGDPFQYICFKDVFNTHA